MAIAKAAFRSLGILGVCVCSSKCAVYDDSLLPQLAAVAGLGARGGASGSGGGSSVADSKTNAASTGATPVAGAAGVNATAGGASASGGASAGSGGISASGGVRAGSGGVGASGGVMAGSGGAGAVAGGAGAAADGGGGVSAGGAGAGGLGAGSGGVPAASGSGTSGQGGGVSGGAAGSGSDSNGGAGVSGGGAWSMAGGSTVDPTAGSAGTSSGPPTSCDTAPLLPKRYWKASASHSAVQYNNVPQNLLDGDVHTWSTGKAQTGDEWLQIDLGASAAVRELSLTMNPDGWNDYPRFYEVVISDQPLDFAGAIRASGAGVYGQTLLVTLVQPVVGRYVLLLQKGSAAYWWTANEFDAACF